MDDDRYTRITLRIPRELHGKLQEASDTTSKSMNAEIVARLERSFEDPVKQSEVDELLERLSDRDDLTQKIAARDRLLTITAVYLSLVVDRVVKSNDPQADRMMELIGRYADCVVQSDFNEAFRVAVEMVRAGTELGVLNAQGQVNPEYEHLKPSLPTRSQSHRRKKSNDSDS